MKTIIAQLIQWPPTSSTVYGLAVLAALGCYALTGSMEGAAAVLGVVKIVLPQDAPAIDKAMQEAASMERDIATAPKA